MPDNDYTVGYRRPPKHTRFSKGTSGNPAGRPRRDVAGLVTSTLDAPVAIRRAGKVETVSGFEAGLRKLIARAVAKGDLKACLKVLKVFEEYGVLKPSPPPSAASPVLVMPKHWATDEWLEMFHRHGPPPWKGPRSGLTREAEEKLSKRKSRKETIDEQG